MMFEEQKQEKKKIDELNQVLIDLMSSKATSVDEHFQLLCTFCNDQDIEQIYDYLRKMNSVRSTYWLIKYLVRIERPIAFEKLLVLSESVDALVRKEVCAGVKRISKKQKLVLLFKLLQSKWKDEVKFAIKELGELRHPKAVFPLIEMLENPIEDEQLCILALRALGRIRDKIAIKILEKYADESTGDVQEESFSALNKFSEILDHEYISRWIDSENEKKREFIFLKILRQQGEKWEKYIVKGLATGSSFNIKQSILTSMREVKTKELFDAVYNLAVSDSSYKIRMLGAAVLGNTVARHNVKWLLNKEAKSECSEKVILIRLLSKCSGNQAVYKRFVSLFKKSKDRKVKLTVIESIGRLNLIKSENFLMDIILNDHEFDYAATLSLSYLVRKDKWKMVYDILNLDEGAKELSVIIFLKFILRQPFTYSIPNFVEKRIEELLGSYSLNIRFLAVRCLNRLTTSDKLYKFLNIARDDESLKVRKAAFISLVEHVNRNPQNVISFLSIGVNEPQYMPIVSNVFKGIAGHDNNYEQVLKILMKLIEKDFPENRQNASLSVLRLMALLRHHINKKKLLFFNAFRSNSWSDIEKWILIHIINSTDIASLKGLEVDFMAGQYIGASLSTKKEYLMFFRKMHVKSDPVEKVVFNDLGVVEGEELYQLVNRTVAVWMNKSYSEAQFI